MLFQKSRCKWIQESDLDSKLFHGYINRKRKKNKILGLQINGECFEEVADFKAGFSCIFGAISKINH